MAAHIPQTHWTTPQKVRLKSQVELAQTQNLQTEKGHTLSKTQLFTSNGIPPRTAYRILSQPDPRRLGNSRIRKETRGRPSKITQRDLRALEHIIQSSGQEGRLLSWEGLAIEAGIEASARTIQRAMGTMAYRRCIACQKSWISPSLATKRLQWAKDMLLKYPTKYHWRHVRFSDETHLGYGSQGRIWVIRKPGERSCPDCIQEIKAPKQKDEKRLHAWACVGYNYKSKLYKYDCGNSNGKMTQKVYIELLKQECLKWPKDWVLEEDGDSGHGPGQSNPVQKWKKDNGLKHYFNCAYSPDLSPIENAWIAPKAFLRKYGHWDDDSVWALALEG